MKQNPKPMGRTRNRIDPGLGRGLPGLLRLSTYAKFLPNDDAVREKSLSELREWAKTSGIGTKALYRDLDDFRGIGYISMVKVRSDGPGGIRRRIVVRFLPLHAIRELALPRYDRLMKRKVTQHDRLSRSDVSRAVNDVAGYLKDLIAALSDLEFTVKEGDALYLPAVMFLWHWVGEIFNGHRNYRARSEKEV